MRPGDSQGAGGRAGPGYLERLVALVVKLDDPRALRALCLIGIQADRSAQVFVAAHASQSLPLLDEAAALPTAQVAVAETFALMLRSPASSLSAEQSQGLRRKIFLLASTHPVAFLGAVAAGQLIDLQPLVNTINVGTRDSIVREKAREVTAALAPLPAKFSSAAALTRTQQWLAATCEGTAGTKHDACASVDGLVADAVRQLGAGNPASAKSALTAVVRGARAATTRRDLTTFQGSLVMGNAQLALNRMK